MRVLPERRMHRHLNSLISRRAPQCTPIKRNQSLIKLIACASPKEATRTSDKGQSGSNGNHDTGNPHVTTSVGISKMSVSDLQQASKQQLKPLPKYEQLKALESIDEEPEVSNVTVQSTLEYKRPKKHRRRPGNAVALAFRNFAVEFKGLLVATLERIAKPDTPDIPEAFGFTLSNEAIAEFDVAHPPPGREPVPPFIQVAYDVLLFFVDRVYEGKAIERFWFLETVARMPYFSYTTCLHLYETLGWWRTGGLRLVHFAEEWNELHHLLIMEALGGDRRWQDRFLGQHAAVFYYWALVVSFLVSPKWSYKFSEMLETHAVSTYRQFILENGDKLKTMPAPLIAQKYYRSDDPYMYNMDSALVRGPTREAPRQPPCDNLYDVFVNILEDEWEHVKTMVMCQDYDTIETLRVAQTTFDPASASRRDLWNRWAEDINDMDTMIELRKL